ncbi:MAG: T9SS type A sorting domain-containing protein [Bacteroidia bacterium]|nr:T9SS type A sorting domain-containing protein [Bacteroidia bacterium]
MKTPNFTVRIPEPCHEDWNKMNPNSNGRHCESCNTTVFDFSGKSDAQITDLLKAAKGEKMCGRFKTTQLNRPLTSNYNLNVLPQNISATRVFAIALFLVFGSFLFSCTDYQDKKIEKTEALSGVVIAETMGEVDVPNETSGNNTDSVMTQQTVTRSEIMGALSSTSDKVKREPEMIEPVIFIETVTAGVMEYYPENYNQYDSISPPIDSLQTLKNSIQEEQERNNAYSPLRIFPNPSKGEVNIAYSVLNRTDVILEVYNLSGQLIKNISNVSNQHQGHYQIAVDLSDLPNGIYLISLIKGGERFTERVLIEK